MISKSFFLLSESFKALFRNKIHTIISGITISIAILFVNIIIFAYQSFKTISYKYKSNFVVDIFYDENISEDKAKEIHQSISLIKGLKEKEFIDKNKASVIFKKYFDEEVEAFLGENPLPFSSKFRINEGYRDLEKINLIINKIIILDGVDDVSYENNMIKKIEEMSESVILSIALIGSFFILISILLVSNTIRLIIDSKKETIRIFELLGATKMFIKVPFLIEGMLQGLIGSFISIFILFSVDLMASYFFSNLISLGIFNVLYILLNLFVGLAMGCIGSSRVISKYL